jgi:aminoglycoside phosphotransferase (APT) family kinase protein
MRPSPSTGLSRAALDRVREAVAPDGHVVRVRPLRGGISASVHLVHLQAADGAHTAVVVRRYGEYFSKTDPAACSREFQLLTLLAATNLPVPRPLLLDAEGGPFGAPTVVMSRLPGRPLLDPRDLKNYLEQMARTLVEMHQLPVESLDFLPDQRAKLLRHFEQPWAETDDPLQLAVWEAFSAEWRRVSGEPEELRVLVHGDYWPGNLLWRRGRLVGVIDWEQPRLGDPAKDVATCRGDLAVLFGQPVADEFVQMYEAAAGRSVTNLRFWDLLISTWAVHEMPAWAVAYRVLGRQDLTPEVATERIRAFARNALNGRASD